MVMCLKSPIANSQLSAFILRIICSQRGMKIWLCGIPKKWQIIPNKMTKRQIQPKHKSDPFVILM